LDEEFGYIYYVKTRDIGLLAVGVFVVSVVLAWLIMPGGEIKNLIGKKVLPTPTGVMYDNKGEKVATVQVLGVVQSWSPETGMIGFLLSKTGS
jgi:hypothetical protein